MQWVHDPSQSNVDNLNNVRREASWHFRSQKKAYLKAKIEEIETKSKIKNIRDMYRGISDFNKGYQGVRIQWSAFMLVSCLSPDDICVAEEFNGFLHSLQRVACYLKICCICFHSVLANLSFIFILPLLIYKGYVFYPSWWHLSMTGLLSACSSAFSTRLLGDTSQKIVIFIVITMGNSDLTKYVNCLCSIVLELTISRNNGVGCVLLALNFWPCISFTIKWKQ